MKDNALEQELQHCVQAAEEGYQLAQENYQEFHKSLQEEQQKIREAHQKREHADRMGDKEADKLFARQMKDIEKLQQTDAEVLRNIQLLHQQQKEFSILVFGQTMAGKSTMMEILTHGNGKSIGKGAQRTTRDIRSYHWNGLKITDVPGICAFAGEADEKLAMEAAKSADLILFMITDDAPQKDEAEKLAELRQYGKPILGVMNVKMALQKEKLNGKQFELMIRKLQKRINDKEKVESIWEQFCEYAKDFGQDWSQIPFVHAHLQAAFLTRSKCSGAGKTTLFKIFKNIVTGNFLAKPKYTGDEATALYNASNFVDVENAILDAVRDNGRFWRSKTFVDSVAVPVHKIMNEVFKHSEGSLQLAWGFIDKQNELDKWGKKFLEDGKKYIDQKANQLADSILKELDDFVDDHYEDEDAGPKWERRFQAIVEDEALQDTLEELREECEEELERVSAELQQEFRFSFNNNMDNMDTSSIFIEGISDNMKPLVQLGVGGLGLASVIGGVALGPIGWAAMGIGALFSIFGDSREDKIREAKSKLKDALLKATKPVYQSIIENMSETFRKMYNTMIVGYLRQLGAMGNVMIDLANSQLHLARKLSGQYVMLNDTLARQADTFISANLFNTVKVRDICRIPGQEMVLILEKNSLREANRKMLEQALGEKVIALVGDDEWFTNKVLVQEVLDNSNINVSFDDNDPTVYIPLSRLTKAEKEKLSLVRQMTGCLIIDKQFA